MTKYKIAKIEVSPDRFVWRVYKWVPGVWIYMMKGYWEQLLDDFESEGVARNVLKTYIEYPVVRNAYYFDEEGREELDGW